MPTKAAAICVRLRGGGGCGCGCGCVGCGAGGGFVGCGGCGCGCGCCGCGDRCPFSSIALLLLIVFYYPTCLCLFFFFPFFVLPPLPSPPLRPPRWIYADISFCSSETSVKKAHVCCVWLLSAAFCASKGCCLCLSVSMVLHVCTSISVPTLQHLKSRQ